MVSEILSTLVGFYAFLTIFALAALAAGPDQWNDFLAAQLNTAMIIFHAIALLYFLFYQTFAWFELAPNAMPVQLGEKKLPASIIVLAHYVAWAVLSALVFWLAGAI